MNWLLVQQKASTLCASNCPLLSDLQRGEDGDREGRTLWPGGPGSPLALHTRSLTGAPGETLSATSCAKSPVLNHCRRVPQTSNTKTPKRRDNALLEPRAPSGARLTGEVRSRVALIRGMADKPARGAPHWPAAPSDPPGPRRPSGSGQERNGKESTSP